MKNLGLTWKPLAGSKRWLAVVGVLLALTGAGQSAESNESPIAIDPLVPMVGTPINEADFAKHHPDLKVPRLQATNIPGFTRIARAEGTPITLFGVGADTAALITGNRSPATLIVTFVVRGNGVRLTQEEFDRKLAEVTEAITKYAGGPPEEKPDYKGVPQPGSTLTTLRLWRDRRIKLAYSRVVADGARQIAFRGEYITVTFQP